MTFVYLEELADISISVSSHSFYADWNEISCQVISTYTEDLHPPRVGGSSPCERQVPD